MTRLLVTGFPPFAGCPVNPTQQLIEQIRTEELPFKGVSVSAELLPVEYVAIESEVQRCLKQHSPDIWLAFGVCRRPELFNLEAIGRNLDESDRPDNAGEVRRSQPIVSGGPEKIRTQWDLHSLNSELNGLGFESRVSDDAGTYLCNHLLYFVQYELRRTGNSCRFQFTHVAPPSAGFPPEKRWQGFIGIAGLFLNRQTAGAELLASTDTDVETTSNGSADRSV